MKKGITWHDDWIIPSAESPASLDFWDFHYKNLQNWRLTSSDYVHTWGPFFFVVVSCVRPNVMPFAAIRNQQRKLVTGIQRSMGEYSWMKTRSNVFWFVCYSFKQFNGVACWRGGKKRFASEFLVWNENFKY